MLAAHATTIGPRSRPRGKSIPATWRLASDSTSRLTTRYPAKNTSSTSLASSPGWKEPLLGSRYARR